MWAKNISVSHSFLGLKIVPQIIEEMNEKAKTFSISHKDSLREDAIRPLPAPQHPVTDSSTIFVQSPSRPLWKLRATTSLPPEREAGLEILDVLLSKANSGSLTSHFIGSPPRRAGNPLIHDARFCDNRALPSPDTGFCNNPSSVYRDNSSAKSSPNSLSCGSKTFIRVEGFTPLNGKSHRGIPAFA